MQTFFRATHTGKVVLWGRQLICKAGANYGSRIVQDNYCPALYRFTRSGFAFGGVVRISCSIVRSGVLTAAFLLLIASPCLLLLASNFLHVDVSSITESELATCLQGSVDDPRPFDCLSSEGFASGQMQDAFEDLIVGNVPLRGQALLANSQVQRGAMQISNMLFRYPCYPTNYGSEVVYDEGSGVLFEWPRSGKAETLLAFREFGKAVASFARRNEEVEVLVVLADNPSYSSANPASRLISDSVSTGDCKNELNSILSDVNNVRVVAKTYENAAEFGKYYYKTDHHWNGWGAIEVAADAFNERQSVFYDDRLSAFWFDGFIFYGSEARKGLFLLNSPVTDPVFRIDDLEIESGKSCGLMERATGKDFQGAGYIGAFSFYSTWYGSKESLCVLNHEPRIASRGGALLIADSYGDSFRWLVAREFPCVNAEPELYRVDENSDITLSQRLEETGSSTIIFAGHPFNYVTFIDRHPKYFL